MKLANVTVAAALVLILAAWPAGAPAQTPPKGASGKAPTTTRPAPTDAKAVLAQMRETLAGAPVYACTCKFTAMIIGAEASLTLRHDPAGAVTGLRITGKALGSPTRFDAASTDGATLRAVNLDDKVYEDTPWSIEKMLAGPPGPDSNDIHMFRTLVPIHFYQPSDLEVQPGDQLKLAGTDASDGVVCDVVELTRPFGVAKDEAPEAPDKEVTRFSIGRDDHLPRRIVRKWVGGQGIPASFPHEFSNWKLNPPTNDQTFTVNVSGMKAGTFQIKNDEGGRRGRGGVPPPGDGGPSLGLKAGEKVSDFALKDTAGKEHKLWAYKGKPVLVHFSTLDSDYSDALLTKMKSKHGDRLVVLDLVVDHNAGGLEAVKKAKKAATFPRLVGGEGVADAWGINLFSLAVVVGPDGRVAASWPTGLAGGAVDEAVDLMVRKMGDYLKNPSKGW